MWGASEGMLLGRKDDVMHDFNKDISIKLDLEM